MSADEDNVVCLLETEIENTGTKIPDDYTIAFYHVLNAVSDLGADRIEAILHAAIEFYGVKR